MSRPEKKPDGTEPAPKWSDDILAQSEAAEFEASVRAVASRLVSQKHAPAAPPVDPPIDTETEIVWSEQSDVYCPGRLNAETYLRSNAAPGIPLPRTGQSIVIIRESAYSTLRDHLYANLEVEQGGLLGGEALYDSDRDLFIVVVEVAMPAHNGEGTPTSFSYTPAAWETIMPGWLAMKGDWTIVGSYHSHPRMGVFLSSIDRSTQAEVFPHDWQVALVMDPAAGQCGLFIGVAGKPCPYYVVAD